MQKNMKITEWTYNGQDFTSDMVGDYYGFVYRITNLVNGFDYIGRKYFKSKRKLKPLKGRILKRHRIVETDWKTYWGSSKRLLEDVEKIKFKLFEGVDTLPLRSFELNSNQLEYVVNKNFIELFTGVLHYVFRANSF